MRELLIEWLSVVALLVGYGAVGGFVVVPFRRALPFGVLAAPFAGLLLLAFGLCVTYNLLGLPFTVGLAGVSVCGLAATAVTLRWAGVRLCWRSLRFPLGVALLLALPVTAMNVSASIAVGEPGLLYFHGTDHLGYGHMADWILAHAPWDRPRVDPSLPYERWPALLFSVDPRFGAFATLAAVAKVRGLSAMFAYDPASAALLTTTILGVAAIFARSRLSLVLLVFGLFTCHWYDYNRTGYFAKTIGYPAAFLVAGLLIQAKRPFRLSTLISLVLMTCGATVVYSAEAPGLLILLVSGSFLAAAFALSVRPSISGTVAEVRRILRERWQHIVMLGLMVLLGLAMRGYVARAWSSENTTGSVTDMVSMVVDPSSSGAPGLMPWPHMRLMLVDLEPQGGGPYFPDQQAIFDVMLRPTLAIWFIFAGLALLRRDPVAMALSWGPLLFLIVLAQMTTVGAQWAKYNLPGSFYPFLLCCAARLLGTSTSADGQWLLSGIPRLAARLLSGGLTLERALAVTVAVLMVLDISMRVPRIVGAIDRFLGPSVPLWAQFAQSEMDGLADAIGAQTVRAEFEDPHLTVAALAELGRRGIAIQWGPVSWRQILPDLPGPPEPARPPDLLLLPITESPVAGQTTVYQTRNYRLVRPAPTTVP